MKKMLILVLTSIAFSYSLKAQPNCNSVTPYGDTLRCDIFTPMGNLVVTYSMVEAATSTREWYDDYWSSRYPNAEMIIVYDGLSSTRKFNCHGYAWLRVEQGIDRWIGYDWPDIGMYPDIYITDSSYIEVSSETFPGKVFWDIPGDPYRYGDHTAITTEQPGWFISKWNMYPLFKHQWNDSPYGTNFKYYVRNCSVLGNETVNVTDRTIDSDTPIKSCGNINVQYVTVTNGATLTLEAAGNIDIQDMIVINNSSLIIDAAGEVTIWRDFEVELGSELDIR